MQNWQGESDEKFSKSKIGYIGTTAVLAATLALATYPAM